MSALPMNAGPVRSPIQMRAGLPRLMRFAFQLVLIETSPTSWKAKRIRRGSPALIWIGERTGPAFIGKAEIVTDTALQDQVIAQYPKKYTLAWIGFARPSRAKLDRGQIVVIRISPTRDLPDGFQSGPGTPAPALDEKPAPSSAN